jgi:acyl-CoA synthetase (AMP-forming)/AMP-acid ligase II
MTTVELVSDVLRVRALQLPDAVAHEDSSGTLTFADWNNEAETVASGLVQAGLRRGDRVLLPISNWHARAFASIYMAVARCGGVSVPMSTRLTAPEIREYCAFVGARWVITDQDGFPNDTVAERVWPLHDTPRGSATVDVTGLRGDDLCDIIPTSGTTGTPKGVVSTHGDLIRVLGDGSGRSPFDALLHALPLTGAGGCHSIMMLPLRAGVRVVTEPVFDAGAFLKHAGTLGVRAIQAVPAMLRLLVDHPDAGAADLHRLRWVFTGSAPLPHDTAQRVAALWPNARLVNLYGMSESGTGARTRSKASVLKPGCVGSPDDPTSIEIRDEAGENVKSGEIGEIWSRAPRPRRYWNDDAATFATWVDGWLKTGDVGFIDADGDLIINGRSKEIIIRGGYNIAPAQIEDVLLAHPDVAEAAVFAIPHAVLGEDVAAAIVLRPGKALGGDDLKAWCAERLANNKIPRQWRVMDDLPKNQNGKVMKHVLARSANA